MQAADDGLDLNDLALQPIEERGASSTTVLDSEATTSSSIHPPRFSLVKLLGRGSQGSVYLAADMMR